MKHHRLIRFRNFDGGMMSAVDNDLRPPTAANLARNIDPYSRMGMMRKATGTSVYDFDGELPDGELPNNEQIISAGHLGYVKVWSDDGNTQVNELWELVVLQINGDNNFDWYELTRKVDGGTWTLDGPYMCNLDPLESDFFSIEKWGATKVGRIRWTEKDGVLRAACGAHVSTAGVSDSYPMQWRYINRHPIADTDPNKNLGFFKIFDSTDANVGECLHSFHGLWRGRSLPDYTPPAITIVSNGIGDTFFFSHDNLGYFNANRMQYALLTELDGHQICGLKLDPVGNYRYPTPGLVQDDSGYSWVTKIKLTIDEDADIVYALPERVTGFRLYRSYVQCVFTESGPAPTGIQGAMSKYGEIARIDIRDGVEQVVNAVANLTDEGTDVWKAKWAVGWQEGNINAPDRIEDIWKDMFLKIQISDTVSEEYKITSCEISEEAGVGNFMNIFITATGTTMVTATNYPISINSRWYDNGSDQVEIVLIDTNIETMDSPPWLVQGVELVNQPKIECNYSKSIITKGRNLVVGIAYDDKIERIIARSSYPIGHPFAGFDLFPVDVSPELRSDDEIMGAAVALDRVYLFGKNKIIQRMITDDGIELLGELPWDIGLASIDGLFEFNSKWCFIGNERGKTSIYIWDGVGRPIPVGDRIADFIETILVLPANNIELSKVYYLPKDRKYIVSIPYMRT
jgi:hypothetical protein